MFLAVVVPADAALIVLVVSFHGVDERRRRVAGADRMTIEEVVRKVLLDEHADVIREAVKAVAAEMMELEVSELIGAERGERRVKELNPPSPGRESRCLADTR